MRPELVAVALAVLFLMPTACGQEPAFDRVEVHVTAVSARNVYIDRGRADRVDVGDLVRLYPLGAPMVEAIVRSVSRSSARADLDRLVPEIRVGTRGEVLIPQNRGDAETRRPPERRTEPEPEPRDDTLDREPIDVPDHPPWQHPPEDWDEELPLLAPAYGLDPKERDVRINGRAYTSWSTVWDDEPEDRRYVTGRTGVDLSIENPFGNAGTLELDSELSYRDAQLDEGEDDSEAYFRPERISYHWGDSSDDTHGFELGRFMHNEFPELGVVDGVEVVRRLDSGDRIGASLGLLPEPDDDLSAGDDTQAAIFYRFVSDEEETVALGAALQKTWHDGRADRDLLVATLDARPTERTLVHTSAWVDYYTSGDDLKGAGLELTQLSFNASYRWESDAGASIFASHFRWPELLREEFAPVADETIEDQHVTRVGLNGWKRFSEHVHVSGSGAWWEDDEDSGTNTDVRVAFRDLLYERGEIQLGVFDADGSFSDGLGWRLGASRDVGRGTVAVSFESTTFEQNGFLGVQEELDQEVLRASFDTRIGDRWSLSVFAEERFGDEQDSFALGLYLQRRF